MDLRSSCFLEHHNQKPKKPQTDNALQAKAHTHEHVKGFSNLEALLSTNTMTLWCV